MKRHTLIIGHRGAPDYVSENTLSSFKKAIELGADMIETDARITKDKKIVLIHDASVNRTTDGKGTVKNLTLNKIKKLSINKDEKVPTLSEAIQLLKKHKIELNLQIKEHDTTDKIVEIIKKNRFQKKIILSAYDEKTLARVKELAPSIRTAYLISKPKIKYISIGKRLNVYALHPMYQVLTERLILRAHKNNFKVNVWTIKNRIQAWKAKILRVDGIITDDPLLYTKKSKK